MARPNVGPKIAPEPSPQRTLAHRGSSCALGTDCDDNRAVAEQKAPMAAVTSPSTIVSLSLRQSAATQPAAGIGKMSLPDRGK
jgi:hypothetical protein